MSTTSASLIANKSRLSRICDTRMEPEEVKALGRRIAQVSDLVGGKRALAAKVEISEGQIYRYINGENVPSIGVIVAIANAGDVSIDWLAAGKGEMRPKPHANQQGVYKVSNPPTNGAYEEKLGIMQQFILDFRKQNPNLDLSSTAIDIIEGDSMADTLNDGDMVVVDRTDRNPHQVANGIYLFTLGRQRLVARFQRVPGDILQVTFDNTKYTPFTIPLSQLPTDFHLSGRIIWRGTRL